MQYAFQGAGSLSNTASLADNNEHYQLYNPVPAKGFEPLNPVITNQKSGSAFYGNLWRNPHFRGDKLEVPPAGRASYPGDAEPLD